MPGCRRSIAPENDAAKPNRPGGLSRRTNTGSRDVLELVRPHSEDMTFQAILIIAVVGAISVLIAVGRAISAAQFGRSLRAAYVPPPARSSAEHDPHHAGDLA